MEGETIVQIREAVCALCREFPGAYWRRVDRERVYRAEFVETLTCSGFLAVLILEAYGGSGLGIRAVCAILEEIHTSGGNGTACHAQIYTMGTVLRPGRVGQKARWLPAIAREELRLQVFGVTEPGVGTDTSSIRTTAVRRGDHWIVDGQKIWTSRVEHSDLMLLLARTALGDQVGRRTDGLSVFLLDMRDALGRGLEIPADSLVGEEGEGFRHILDGMNAERILIAAEYIGDGRWFVGKAAGLYATGLPCAAEANMAKLLASEASWVAADNCRQTHGDFGFAEEYDVERKFGETRLYQVAPVSTNMILSYVAEHVLGLPRSY